MEWNHYVKTAEDLPGSPQIPPLAEYREALQIGNREKAAFLRNEIADTAALERIDAEFAETFRISSEPLTLEFSDDLPVDLTSPSPLQLNFRGYNTLFLNDGSDDLIMIDFAARAARRLTAPQFAKITPWDSLPDGTVLFAEHSGEDTIGDTLWRAKLSTERPAFTAKLGVEEWFGVEDPYVITDVYMSTEKDTEYFVKAEHVEGLVPDKILKRRLAPKTTVETLQLTRRGEPNMRRLTSHPDRFLIEWPGVIKTMSRNLSLKESLLDTAKTHGMYRNLSWNNKRFLNKHLLETPKVYATDARNGDVYCLEKVWLTHRDRNLSLIKHFHNALSIGMFHPDNFHGLSFETNTALAVLQGDKQSFYNFRTNKFSSKIRVGRVLPCMPDGKWYCFDYDSAAGKLRLRDITQAIHANLEWKEVVLLSAGKKKGLKNAAWFGIDENFLYRPEEWQVSEGVCW